MAFAPRKYLRTYNLPDCTTRTRNCGVRTALATGFRLPFGVFIAGSPSSRVLFNRRPAWVWGCSVPVLRPYFHVGETFKDRPLIYTILFKSAVFAALLICFHLIEET